MILIVAAMDIEASDILKSYPFKRLSEHQKLFKYQHHQKEIYLIITGVGKVNAAHALTETLVTLPIKEIYNIGFAGATKAFKQSDVVCIDQTSYHDFNLTMFGYEMGQVPGYPVSYKSDERLLNHAKHILKGYQSKLLTGDVFVTEDYQDTFLVDMEGAALYQVAYIKTIPIVSIKVVSDIIGADQHLTTYRQFEASLGAQILKKVFETLILEV